MAPIRVFLADDHHLFRISLVRLLDAEEGTKVVGQASSGDEAVAGVRKLRPDVALLDVHMPVMGGVEATRHIRAECPDTRVVLLTVCEDEETLFEAVKAGAQGYVLKNITPDVLLEHLRDVVKGGSVISPIVASKILSEFAKLSRGGGSQSPASPLSAREREVLELVVRGLSNRDIAGALIISEHTVKNHLRNIMDKLQLDNRVQLVTFALKHGIVAPES